MLWLTDWGFDSCQVDAPGLWLAGVQHAAELQTGTLHTDAKDDQYDSREMQPQHGPMQCTFHGSREKRPSERRSSGFNDVSRTF